MQQLKGYVKSYKFNKFYTKENKFIIAGYASRAIVDRVDDLVLPQAFSKSLENFKQGKLKLPLLLEHKTPIGKILGAIIALLGIGTFALPAGILASGFAEEIQRRQKK